MTKLLGTLAFAGIVLSARPAAADKTFSAGSLIIPATSAYQNDCGAVAMYGLIYDVLRANAWLEANAAYEPIEVYYTYSSTKSSPNRCIPTNTQSGPTSSATWLDGCDFSVKDASSTVPPVKLVNNNNTGSANDTTITTVNTSASSTVYPRYASVTISAPTVNEVRYWGGSFVIDQSDAATFLALVQGTLIAKDNGVNIDFSPFRTTSGCTFGTTIGGRVAIHRAQVAFTAPVPKYFDASPPRLALLAIDSTNETGTVYNNILQNYLKRAGLSFTGAQGCPVGGKLASNGTYCPSGGTPGEIYDIFDFDDLRTGKLANLSGSTNTYKMLWAPHWELDTTSGSTTNEDTSITNISQFLDGQTGLMAECASIESFEGSTSQTASTNGRFQTCKDSGDGVTCTSSTTAKGLARNSAGSGSWYSDPTGTLRNCSDVNMTAGSDCYYIGYPSDPYVQIGDYRWVADYGHVADFKPTTGQIYKSGVQPLISGVTSLNTAYLTSPATARAMIKGDFVSRNSKDNDPNKANILYLGGHDLTGTIAGTKVVLQTLLQLGSPEVITSTTEVSRASPIIGNLAAGVSLVQGTFESVQPSGTPKTMASDGDAASFEFPFVIGHLRAYTGVGSTATAYDSITAAFDANLLIPTATYAGCSTNFTSACRTVFTNLDANCRVGGTPCTRTFFSDGNATALGAVMASDLTSASQQTLVRRVLEGVPDVTATNQYVARLGGIDRSTVAIIEESLLAGSGTRPTMIYVGATDGMLHAICTDNTAPCDQAGRELWAFMPRNQLSIARYNTTRIDGSPRVQDLYGDFDGTGTKSYRTVLTFQTTGGAYNATYALDITDPTAPKILWEYQTAGRGLFVTAGRISDGRAAVFIQTNTGTSTAGTVVTAVDAATGTQIWSSPFTYTYPTPRNVANAAVPTSGIPGGAVAVDRNDSGNVTDVVFSTLYGDIFALDALTGANRYAPNPLFRFTTDLKPFGAPPSLYSNGGAIFAAAASGGYAELDPTTNPQWSSTSVTQQAVSVSLNTPVGSAPLTETTTPLSPIGLSFVTNLGTGAKSFAQVQVVGNELFVTSDSSDVNASTYGTLGTDTGSVMKLDQTGAQVGATVVVAGGAGSVGKNGTTIYSSSANKAQELSLTAATATPTSTVMNLNNASVSRRLWLRTL